MSQEEQHHLLNPSVKCPYEVIKRFMNPLAKYFTVYSAGHGG